MSHFFLSSFLNFFVGKRPERFKIFTRSQWSKCNICQSHEGSVLKIEKEDEGKKTRQRSIFSESRDPFSHNSNVFITHWALVWHCSELTDRCEYVECALSHPSRKASEWFQRGLFSVYALSFSESAPKLLCKQAALFHWKLVSSAFKQRLRHSSRFIFHRPFSLSSLSLDRTSNSEQL